MFECDRGNACPRLFSSTPISYSKCRRSGANKDLDTLYAKRQPTRSHGV